MKLKTLASLFRHPVTTFELIEKLLVVIPMVITQVEMIMGAASGAEKEKQAKELIRVALGFVNWHPDMEAGVAQIIGGLVLVFNALGIFPRLKAAATKP